MIFHNDGLACVPRGRIHHMYVSSVHKDGTFFERINIHTKAPNGKTRAWRIKHFKEAEKPHQSTACTIHELSRGLLLGLVACCQWLHAEQAGLALPFLSQKKSGRGPESHRELAFKATL